MSLVSAIRGSQRASASFLQEFSRTLGPTELATDGDVVTQMLYARLSHEDVEQIIDGVTKSPILAAMPVIGDDPPTRRWLSLNYGVWLRISSVLERTGLSPDQPPEDVHAMARGPLAAAGGLGEADLIADALLSVGGNLQEVGRALDFGCSSGRVLRVLKAAFPHVGWHGCDPNEAAVAWAAEHLPGIEFFVSRQEPPLPLGNGSLGLVYAISIWSHFAPELGLRWFEEIHRVLATGGYLVFTTHGMQSVAFDVMRAARSADQAREMVEALYHDGYWYRAEFGQSGDSGVVNPQWGTAFLSAEWVLANLCPRWRLLEYAPGRNQGNQDVYVLQRA